MRLSALKFYLAFLAALAILPSNARASDIVLTVTGNVTKSVENGTVSLTREELETMPSESFVTTTIWTEGAHEFTGVALHVLLNAVGAEGATLKATALNDYSVEIPVTDAVPGGPIVAYLMDGGKMSVRDKGPLWIVYPYDHDADYRTETIYSRSIWQLDRLEVLE